MKRKNPIVAIDGPAGSGKSTLAKLLAKRLGFSHIDTGALYRGVAFITLENSINPENEKSVLENAKKFRFEFKNIQGENLLFLNGVDVSKKIRTEEVGGLASKVSAYPSIRSLLLGLQRELGESGAAVLEGRDIGTVVFPDAEIKIFLTASLDTRVQRRITELQERGLPIDENLVRKQVAQRDEQDIKRAIAPLKKADDAIELDTSSLTIEVVVSKIEKIVKNHA